VVICFHFLSSQWKTFCKLPTVDNGKLYFHFLSSQWNKNDFVSYKTIDNGQLCPATGCVQQPDVSSSLSKFSIEQKKI